MPMLWLVCGRQCRHARLPDMAQSVCDMHTMQDLLQHMLVCQYQLSGEHSACPVAASLEYVVFLIVSPLSYQQR
jgi:hypothetical protein